MAPQSGSGKQKKAVELIQKIAAMRAGDPDKVGLWNDVAEVFGGRKAFIHEMKMVYDDCPDGSANKVRMASIFLEIFARAADVSAPSEPESEMSLEDLGATLAEVMSDYGNDSAGAASSTQPTPDGT